MGKPSSQTLLKVEELRKDFYLRQPGWRPFGSQGLAIRAVDGVSLTLDQGESLALVGESGSGKSTLARCLLRLEEPTSGKIFFRGQDLLALQGAALKAMRRAIQPVFQDPVSSLNPRMKVGDIIGEPLRIHRLGDARQIRARVEELLSAVGLSPAAALQRPHEFSGGQRQRISIARALAPGPELLIADEPVSALDVSVQGQIINLFKDLKDEFGLTLLFISHSLPVVSRLCDRIMVMYRGRVLESASTQLLFDKPRHPYTQRLLAASLEPSPEQDLPQVTELPAELALGELEEVEPGHWVARASSDLPA